MQTKLLTLALAFAGLFSIASGPVAAHGHHHDRDFKIRVETRSGPVVGVDDSKKTDTYFWKGVPFAKPPVGDLRWRAPQDPQSWKKPLPTQKFGNACAQNGRLFSPGANNRFDETIATTLNTAVGSEDCLYLNIWRPANHKGDLPVIVFVYGGSNISRYTVDPVFDGAALGRNA
jgi:para-nitrobenzyl esterase